MSTTETNIKPQQTSLLGLPNELLFLIIDNQDMSWKDYFSIHHVSSRFFQMTFKQVYDGERDLFKHACSRANVKLMISCLEHKNDPICQLWGPVGGPGVEQYYPPLDVLLQGYLDDYFSGEKYVEAAEWLLKNGYSARQFRWDEDSATSSVLPPVLLTRLSTARDAVYHRGIRLVIKFLINTGLELPSDFPRRIAREKEDRSKYRPLLHSSWASPMEMVLQSACPPFLFEVHLKRAILEQQLPPNLFKGNTRYYDVRQRYTTIDELLSLLFDDFFSPWIFKGESPSYFGDTFEGKVKLMWEHDFINSKEQSVLKDIAKALRRVEARHGENGGLDFDRDGTWCWRELCTSISYICGGYITTPGDVLSDTAPCSGRHEFLRPRGWYPPDDIAHSRTWIIKDIRHKLDPSRFEDNTEADWVNMPLDAWNVFLRGKSTGWELTKGGCCYLMTFEDSPTPCHLVEMEKSNCSGECKTEQNLYAGCRQSAGTGFIDHIHTHAYMRLETPFVLLHVMPV
ncbi:hypothetical protein FOXYSP1_00333 [Fusarium oxysporum f. sp. phaseoli]